MGHASKRDSLLICLDDAATLGGVLGRAKRQSRATHYDADTATLGGVAHYAADTATLGGVAHYTFFLETRMTMNVHE